MLLIFLLLGKSLNWAESTSSIGEDVSLQFADMCCRVTQQETNDLTSLYSLGMYFAADVLGMEELKNWREFELGRRNT